MEQTKPRPSLVSARAAVLYLAIGNLCKLEHHRWARLWRQNCGQLGGGGKGGPSGAKMSKQEEYKGGSKGAEGGGGEKCREKYES